MNNQEIAHSTAEVTGVLTPFWRDRLIEAGLILSMGLYYLVGNSNFGSGGSFLHMPPYVYSLPFLAIFAFLSWYRLPFAIALLPLALPYYLAQKTVFSYGSRQLEFSVAEISLAVSALVAAGQFLVHGREWRYRLTWTELRDRLGPFPLPILIFVAAALFSIVIAVDRQTAVRAFREEIFDPLLYLYLALCCLRTRQDVKRLLWSLLGSALIVAAIGLIQYFFFPAQLQQSLEGGRVDAMYGSANSIGLFFDYVLPIGMALLIFQAGKALHAQESWRTCALIAVGFVPLIGVLYFSQSLGAALALPVALLFIGAMSLRSRRVLLIGGGVLVVLALGIGIFLHKPLEDFITTWHANDVGIGTFSKRYYLWLSALGMIGQHPLFGVGMDNWLCYFSPNSVCPASQTIAHHFWVTIIPGTNQPTGLTEEPTLSHPHEIFLQIWVSMGIFGLLAFLGILSLFFWLFARIAKTVRTNPEIASLEWLLLGVGGAMVAALFQGLVDSSFLEQDLAFCFWMLVATLLILRVLSGTSWRSKSTG